MYARINGVKALTLFDSGCSIDAISPEFARVANLTTFKLDTPIPLQLGCVGSRSVINFGVRADMQLGARSKESYFDIANIDHYDAIIGIPLLVQWGVKLDFETQTIRFDDQVIESLRVAESDARVQPTGRKVNRTAAKYPWAESSKPE